MPRSPRLTLFFARTVNEPILGNDASAVPLSSAAAAVSVRAGDRAFKTVDVLWREERRMVRWSERPDPIHDVVAKERQNRRRNKKANCVIRLSLQMEKLPVNSFTCERRTGGERRQETPAVTSLWKPELGTAANERRPRQRAQLQQKGVMVSGRAARM